MIIGVGTDILDIKRFKEKFSSSLLNRVFTEHEVSCCNLINNEEKKINFLAKRFAAKEATSKALGCGIGENISWKDIEVQNDTAGAPFLKLSEKALCYIYKKFQCTSIKTHLSLSDDKNAIAFVVIEK